MYTLARTLLDILFPISNDARMVRSLVGQNVSTLYTHTLINGTIALSRYNDTHVRALIHEAKFHNNTDASQILGALFAKYLDLKHGRIDIIIPIPLSRARMRARGYNQIERVLRECSLSKETEIRTNILTRARNTRPQTELKKSERLTNVRDAFGVAHGDDIAHKHILLVDDVTTTGATLLEAKKALITHSPASITCIALAH